jgi:type I restriction enzyme M protein
MVLNKSKANERKDKILFINANKESQQHPEVRKLNQLGENHIQRITEAYRKFEEERGFSRPVDIESIKENDYNLNVTLYVFSEEEIEEIDVNKEWQELKMIETEIRDIDEKIEDYLKEMS